LYKIAALFKSARGFLESLFYASINDICIYTFSEVVDIDIEDNGDGTVNIYYTVADAGDYTLSIKFGGQPVPDGFYTFTVSKTMWHLIRFRAFVSSIFPCNMRSKFAKF